MPAVKGRPPTKECPGCHQWVHCRVRMCTGCGAEFTFKSKSGPRPAPEPEVATAPGPPQLSGTLPHAWGQNAGRV